MSLDSLLIGKIGGGLCVAGGVTGAGVYAYKTNWFSNFFSGEIESVYIAEKTTDVATTSVADKDFVCEATTSEKSDAKSLCFLKKLNFESKSFLDLQQINNTNSNTFNASSDFTDNTYYRLKIKNDIIKNATYDDSTFIYVKYSVSESGVTTDKYQKLKIIAKINDENDFQTSNKFVLLQAIGETISDTADISDYACKFGTINTQVKCKVYKFNPQATQKTGIDFSKTESITKLQDISKNNYYVVDFSSEDSVENKKLINNVNIKNTFTQKKDDDSKKMTFNFVSYLSGKFSETKTNNKVFVLTTINSTK